MPKYTYECNTCGNIQEKRHGMTEAYSYCPNCDEEGNITRIPSVSSIFTKNEGSPRSQKTGHVVEDFIKSSREDLAQEKQRLKDISNMEHQPK